MISIGQGSFLLKLKKKTQLQHNINFTTNRSIPFAEVTVLNHVTQYFDTNHCCQSYILAGFYDFMKR